MTVTTGIILASLGMAGWLVWKEIKRPVRAHLLARLTTSLGAVAALAVMALPVTYTSHSSAASAHTILLLTPGYTTGDLNRFKDLPRYTTHASIASGNITWIPDLPWFLARHPDIGTLQVAGYGLEEAALAALPAKGIQLKYQAPSLPAGFTAAGWPRQLHRGEWLEVQGTCNAPGKDPVKLFLTGMGTRLDSAIIQPGAPTPFRLRHKPAVSGPLVFELEAFSASQTIAREKLPVQVSSTSYLQVLLLSSSPDFDNKFLGTWLYENQYQVAIRHTISRNKYSVQFLNREALPLQILTPSLLEKMDVVIIDQQAWSDLNAAEKAALRSQVNQGMGLLLQADTTLAANQLPATLPIKKQTGGSIGARPLILPAVRTTTAPLQPGQWLSIEATRQAQPLVMDNQGTVVASVTLAGAGKLVINTLNNTYSWLLSGNRPDYAQFWSLLLHKAARRAVPSNSWEEITAFPSVGSPVAFTLSTGTRGLPLVQTPDGQIAMMQKDGLSHTWTGTWWPVKSGWQWIHEQDSLPLYIYEQQDWAAAKAIASMTINQRQAAVSGQSPASKTGADRKEEKQVPPVIFLVVFLACCSYLWWETRNRY